MLFFYAEDLGQTIYGDKTIGRYIMLFSALMPIAYMDSVTDGMLRGLGQHLYSMKYNVIDSSISVLLIWLLLPRYGVAAYVFVLYFSEIFNFSLSIGRLRKVTKISLQLTEILRGMFAVFSAVNITEAVLRLAHFPLVWKPIYLSVHIAASSVLYAVIMYLTGEKENRLGQYLRDLLVFDKRRKDTVSGRQTAREKHRCL